MKLITHALVLSALAAATLAGCSSEDTGHGGHMTTPTTAGTPTPGASTADRNEADIAFASMMIPHHRQALEMADLVPSHTKDPELTALAAKIRTAQDPEITQMSQWLTGWGAPVPDPAEMHHGDGMMSMEDMAKLGAAKDAAFDRLWLELMIQHHEGAVTMSRTELAQGSNAAAKALAQAIIDGQTAEIATMKAMLAS